MEVSADKDSKLKINGNLVILLVTWSISLEHILAQLIHDDVELNRKNEGYK